MTRNKTNLRKDDLRGEVFRSPTQSPCSAFDSFGKTKVSDLCMLRGIHSLVKNLDIKENTTDLNVTLLVNQ
jgi:hypothetical protein